MFTTNHATIESSHSHLTSLAPNEFLEKQMTLSKNSLINLYQCWINAIDSFLNRTLKYHDALVGENACHIRAAYLFDLINDTDNWTHLEQLNLVKTKINHSIHLIKEISFDHTSSNMSIYEFLCFNNLLLDIPSELINPIKFIVDSYLLTITKESSVSEQLCLIEHTNYHPIRDMGFSKSKAKCLISNTQRSLSYATCKYVLLESRYIENSVIKMFLRTRRDSHGRYCLPQFFVAKVLLSRILDNNKPVLLKINRFFEKKKFDSLSLYLVSNESKTDFKITTTPMKSICIVAEGFVNYQTLPENKEVYLNKLFTNSIIDILLSIFAVHPQYSGDIKDSPPPFTELLNEVRHNIHISKNIIEIKLLLSLQELILAEQIDYELKKINAGIKGCTLQNPSLIVLTHIFCDVVT